MEATVQDAFKARLLQEVEDQNGIKLANTRFTNEMLLDLSFNYRQMFAGPFRPVSDLMELTELRVFLVYTKYKETNRVYVQIIVQDCEGDFLNSNVSPLNEDPLSFTWI